MALLWPDRALLGMALCFLVGAAVSQARTGTAGTEATNQGG